MGKNNQKDVFFPKLHLKRLNWEKPFNLF